MLRLRLDCRCLHLFLAGLTALGGMGICALGAEGGEISFDRDVMAVLSKAGCNMGACHGNLNGKGGFKLSLRGQDSAADFESLVRGADQRRVNLLDPAASLILQKPTGQAVHQGGLRFKRDSLEYQILADWIAAGAPLPNAKSPRLKRLEVKPPSAVLIEPVGEVQLMVTAYFSDGTQQDVTPLACYEATSRSVSIGAGGLVTCDQLGETTVLVRFLNQQLAVQLAFLPANPQFSFRSPQQAGSIDELVFAKLQTLRTNPSALADDTTFIRRATLDATGLLPTADEARDFVADVSPDKRERLIEQLLARPEFAEHWALKWSDLLRNEEKVLDSKGVDLFYTWIRDWIAANRPMDEFVRELVAARGSTYDNPPANFYRANRDPLTRGETAARLFLGVRLQCARCHNHPYDSWTQDDYYNWAAVFGRIDYQILANKRRDRLDKHEFNGEQVVLIKDAGEVQNPRTGGDAQPTFLGGYSPPLHPAEDRLPPLADWLAAADNGQFVRAQVNFVWYHLLGRGLVEPIDDFRVTNPPSNPALLDFLATDYASCGFDLQRMVRTIMTSRTYQLSAEPNETNAADEANFSRAIVRRLPAETLLDAQFQAVGAVLEFNGYPVGTRAGQVKGTIRVRSRDKRPASADRFLKTFGKPERLLACECERSNETTLKQAFTLIGDEGLNELLDDDDNRLAGLARSELPASEIVADLYWSALSRAPTSEELAAGESLLQSADDRFVALRDLAWALLNSKE
ncbi:MAG TPA: DUF1549 and DUF1553 domain-containing protein, partial [Pirellulaceae bacterium]|nr:DUF1549 and DUF1553 domain-containing protein [Pirellulaceae bacterium]